MSDGRSTTSEAVATFLQSLYSGALAGDRELYHYTSLNGLVGILESRRTVGVRTQEFERHDRTDARL